MRRVVIAREAHLAVVGDVQLVGAVRAEDVVAQVDVLAAARDADGVDAQLVDRVVDHVERVAAAHRVVELDSSRGVVVNQIVPKDDVAIVGVDVNAVSVGIAYVPLEGRADVRGVEPDVAVAPDAVVRRRAGLEGYAVDVAVDVVVLDGPPVVVAA